MHSDIRDVTCFLWYDMLGVTDIFFRSRGRSAGGPQQVSPVWCAACARQKTHVAVCHSFAVGVYSFFDFVEKRINPTRMGSVREPGSLTLPQPPPLRGWWLKVEWERSSRKAAKIAKCRRLPAANPYETYHSLLVAITGYRQPAQSN